MSSFDPKGIEEEVRRYWDTLDLHKIVEEHLIDKEKIGFVEGPPTLNGEPHIGHIRGRIMKDLWYRFNILKGRRIVFHGGWDTQGLPVELQAEKELGLAGSKAENLKAVGEEAIVAACKQLIQKYYEKWREADRFLGMSLDHEKAYWTYKDEYIEREWQYLRKAWERGLLGEGYKIVAYCPNCQTSLSHSEVGLGYTIVEDPSLYYKVKLREEDVYLILWTTMPFTVVTDELIGVKPEAQYVYLNVNGERWVVGEERAKPLMNELAIDVYQEEGRVRGESLRGKRYYHPLSDRIPGQREIDNNPAVHSIVAEEFVDTTTGTGLVHMSPGNGEEDFQVGSKMKLPVFCPIDDQARFTEEAGVFAGMYVRDADKKVVEELKKSGTLVKIGKIRHEYPTCWRSHHKIVWLARREYFYWVDKLGEMAVNAADNVEYFYEPPRNRFLEIIKEKVPWNLSRERVWGTPLPIWVCKDCGEKTGLFSRKEIIARAVRLPDGPNFELHRPWIDRINVKCGKCGGESYREPFVLDTWHNSGAAPYSGVTDEEYTSLIPAAFLTEGIDQTRGWAYSLLILNVLFTGEPQAPYRSFLFQGHVLDEKGEKMSKSLGNMVDASETLKKNPVDILRFYLMWKASPIDALNFSLKEMAARPYQILSTLYHLHLYFVQNSRYDDFDLVRNGVEWAKEEGLLRSQELWLLSELQRVIQDTEKAYDRCFFHEAARSIEKFVIETLSQTYVPMTRNEIWDDSPDTLQRRLAIYAVLGFVLGVVDIIIHPISPYLTDHLYRESFNPATKTLLIEQWPELRSQWRDQSLEGDFELLGKLISITNAARMKGKLKRRWPLKSATYLVTGENLDRITKHQALLVDQVNVKDVHLKQRIEDLPVKITAKPRLNMLAPKLRSGIKEFQKEFTQAEPYSVYESLRDLGKFTVTIDGRSFDVLKDEVEFDYEGNAGFEAYERDGIVVAIATGRDEKLQGEGVMRDIARRFQSLRKEKGFNPTDIRSVALVSASDPEIRKYVESGLDELAYLVRVRKVRFLETIDDNVEWRQAEIDGKTIRISIT